MFAFTRICHEAIKASASSGLPSSALNPKGQGSVLKIYQTVLERCPKAVIAGKMNYKEARTIDTFITFPRIEELEGAQDFVDRVLQKELPARVKTVGFISTEALSAMAEGLSEAEVAELRADRFPLDALLLEHRRFSGFYTETT